MVFLKYYNKGEGDFIAPPDCTEYDCIKAAYNVDDWQSDAAILTWARRYKNYAILGTGGSSLSGQAIKCASGNHNVEFLDNICPYEFYNWLNNIDIDNTGIVVISKSGETIETLAQIQLVLQKFNNIGTHLLVITENKESTLMNLGRSNNALYIEHPKTIGGRFSIFSPVGMFPAYLMQQDINELKSGAISALKFTEYQRSTSFVLNAYDQKISNQVFMFYSPRLKKFGSWLEQLYAESSGKNGIGITPLLATGTTDQHSKLQLYLGGPADKIYSLFIEQDDNPQIRFNDNTTPSHLKNRSLGELFTSEAYATSEAIKNRQLPLRIFECDKISAHNLGWLFMHFMLETISICKGINVNPFDQPNVEEGKRLVKSALEDMQRYPKHT